MKTLTASAAIGVGALSFGKDGDPDIAVIGDDPAAIGQFAESGLNPFELADKVEAFDDRLVNLNTDLGFFIMLSQAVDTPPPKFLVVVKA